jgi:hypothetical protein
MTTKKQFASIWEQFATILQQIAFKPSVCFVLKPKQVNFATAKIRKQKPETRKQRE